MKKDLMKTLVNFNYNEKTGNIEVATKECDFIIEQDKIESVRIEHSKDMAIAYILVYYGSKETDARITNTLYIDITNNLNNGIKLYNILNTNCLHYLLNNKIFYFWQLKR